MRLVLTISLAILVSSAAQLPPSAAAQSSPQGQHAAKGPSPGTEAAARLMLRDLQSRKPNLSNLAPPLAAIAKSQMPDILETIRSLGPLRSFTFRAVDPQGSDIYELHFARGTMEWRIAPLTKDGKIEHLDFRREYSLRHLIKIGGGRRMNMVCTGTGSPTVVFMQGFNGGITDWRDVREPVSALTRACFYDRAGFGYSDPSDKPMTSDNIAVDLHALLSAAGIKDRVVLVGHSMGGLYATYYADKFFSDIAGMVLVDPSFDGQFKYVRSSADEEALQLDADQFYSLMKKCAKLAHAGDLSLGSPRNCFQMPPGTPNETEYLAHLFTQPSYYDAMRSQFENYTPVEGSTLAGDQEHHLKRAFGNVPLIVMTAGLQPWTLTEEGKKAMWAVWQAGHDGLAQRSSRGESIFLPNAHHFIQGDQPDAVVAAIRKVVMEARQP